MYLDKPLRDHTLLQTICRTNRPGGETKAHGLIVDYLGVFDDAVAQAIQFDEEGIARVVTNLNELVAALPAAVQRCLARFPGVNAPPRLRGTDRRPGVSARQCDAQRLRRRLQLPYGYVRQYYY